LLLVWIVRRSRLLTRSPRVDLIGDTEG